MSLLTPLVPTFPNQLTNGTPADASQVMADFNNLRNAINNVLNATGATGGDQYVGITTNSRYQGTSVFDALTQLMDRFQEADTGSVNAIVITPTPAVSAYGSGMFFLVKPANTTTSATPTLKVGSATALTIVNANGSSHVPGAIQANKIALFWIDTVNSQAVHINPLIVSVSFTLTLSGMSSGGTGTVNANILPDAKTICVAINSAITGNSNATTMTGTGVPAYMATASGSSRACILGVDNGVNNTLNVSGLNTTTWTFTYSPSISVFTASGLKGINGSSFTYGA